MPVKQWVNLPKTDAFARNGVTLERLGPLGIVVETERDDNPVFYQLKLTPIGGGDDVTYTRTERARNANFGFRHVQTAGVSDKQTILIGEACHLPAAGGNRYRVEAKDADDNVVSDSVEVEVWRKLFYEVICMEGLSAPSFSDLESEYCNEGAKRYNLVLEGSQAGEEMDLISNVETRRSSHPGYKSVVYRNAGRIFSLDDLEPYSFVVAIVNQIARRGNDPTEYTVPASSFSVGSSGARAGRATVRLPFYLWFGLDESDDARNGGDGIWLREAWLTDGTSDLVRIAPDDITLGAADTRRTQERFRTVELDLSDARYRTHLRASGVTVRLRVYKVNGFVNGFRTPVTNFVCFAKNAGWDPRSDEDMVATAIHEVGHLVGMVATGRTETKSPDAHAQLYGEFRTGPRANNRGHQGPHCGNGATWDGSRWSGTPGCVMFGSSGIASGGSITARADTFCSLCEPVVRKLDLDFNNVSRYRRSIKTYGGTP